MNTKMELPGRLLIGLSGGADSVAMCRLLLPLREAGRLWLGVVHVNHHLRGEDSDGDEAFVRELCLRENLRLYVYHAQPPEHPGEDWARETRYGFFRQALEESGAQAVALAHHRDDQAETLLLHLLRGAGLTGLSGMEQDTVVLGVRVVRPLLGYSRQELRDVLLRSGQTWREDASNRDPRFLRNALRHELLPMMEQLAPGAMQRMAASAELLREDEGVLAQWAEAFLVRHGGSTHLPLKPLQELPTGMQRRVLRLWWQRCAGSDREERNLSRQQTEALTALIHAGAGARCNLPDGCHGQRGWTHIHLTGLQEAPIDLAPEEEAFTGDHGDGKRAQAMPLALYRQCEVRTRRKGDWIRPFGCSGKQSLQDYFVNKKVDAPFRDRVPLLCRGSEVLLAAGVGAGCVPPVNDSDILVMVRWAGEMPWYMNEGGTHDGT